MCAPSKEEILSHISVGTRLVAALASLVMLACGTLKSTLPTGCTISTTLTVGDTIRASLGPSSCQEADGTYVDFYDLLVTSQANLVIGLSSPGDTTFMRLYDQRRAIVVNSALFKAPDTTARVRVMLGTGNYQLAVHGTVAGAAGAYRLIATPDTSPVAGCGVVWVTPGIQTTQNLTSTDCTQSTGGTTHFYHLYEMVMLFTQSATFTEHSSAFSPSMTLFQSGGGSVNSTLDSAGTTATIPAFATTADAYQLWVGSLQALQTGTYTLTIK